MEKKETLLGFSLIEMLIVMAIIIILMSFGAGAFLGFRETALVRENVETLKQDVLMAQHLAMNVKKGSEVFWIYGIGIDLRNIDTAGNYNIFQWCSPYKNFSETASSTELIGYDPSGPIGVPITGSPTLNGYLPVPPSYASNCGGTDGNGVPGGTLVKVSGYERDRIVNIASSITLPGENPGEIPRFVVFETVTGRAFLYTGFGKPINYTGSVPFDYFPEKTLDILIERRRSSLFDTVSIFPISGNTLHHVYSDDDLAENPGACGSSIECVLVGTTQYKKFTIEDEIKSYR